MQRSVLIPEGYSRSYRYPLVVWLCRDEREQKVRMRQFPRISSRNYMALFLVQSEETLFDSSRQFWNQNLLELLCELPVHRQRIYLAGVGDCGRAAYEIMTKSNECVSGAISLLCHLPLGFLTKILSEGNAVSALEKKHGSMRLFWMPPYSGQMPKPIADINHDSRSPFWLSRESSLGRLSNVWREIDQFVMRGIYSSNF